MGLGLGANLVAHLVRLHEQPVGGVVHHVWLGLGLGLGVRGQGLGVRG